MLKALLKLHLKTKNSKQWVMLHKDKLQWLNYKYAPLPIPSYSLHQHTYHKKNVIEDDQNIIK